MHYGLLYFNFNNMSKPYDHSKISNEISYDLKYFMTPFSDVIYGDFGGYGSNMLENRKVFNSVKNLITENILIVLLHSINPATRLCAAEFYFNNKSNFKRRSFIEKLIEMNFKALPKIDTMSGCIQFNEDAKKVLTQMISKRK